MKVPGVAILGAGIGGSCAAIALKRKGFDVEVFERGKQPATTGAGLILWSNASCILDHLGLLREIELVGGPIDTMQRLTQEGELLCEFDIHQIELKLGYRSFSIARKELLSILLDELKKMNVPVNYECNVANITSLNDKQAVVHFENGKQLSADMVVGADGRMNSIARRYVVGNNTPVYQGYINWVGFLEDSSVNIPSLLPGRELARQSKMRGILLNA